MRIGCSGWSYKHWRGRFYPDAVPVRQWLPYYAARFDTVETNGTFYRLPEVEAVAAWTTQVPPSFLMAVKASRYLTHLKRLKDAAEPLHRLFERVAPLGRHLGPVLYQLPPHFHRDEARLAAFLHALPTTLPDSHDRVPLRHVIEFRDPSWYTEAVFSQLAEAGVALCLHDMAGSAITTAPAAPFVYVRFHGAGGRYFGSYAEATLDRWAERLAGECQAGRDVYAYFNNDPDAAAPRDAAVLRAALDARLSSRPRSRHSARPRT